MTDAHNLAYSPNSLEWTPNILHGDKTGLRPVGAGEGIDKWL